MFPRVKVHDFPLSCHSAYYFAKCKHNEVINKDGTKGQKRKGSGVPYFVHPKGVAAIIMEYGGTEDQIKATLLHDTIEDTDTSYLELKANFGEHVAELVHELTNCKYEIEKIGKEDYMSNKLLHLSEEALLVKLADMLYNITDMPALQAEIRMLKNVSHTLLHREFKNDECYKLAVEVFGVD